MTVQGEAVDPTGLLIPEAGAPVAGGRNSPIAGFGGPAPVRGRHLLKKLAHLNRERVPERIVHARGAGAYGTFRVAAGVSCWTRRTGWTRWTRGGCGGAHRYRAGINAGHLPVDRPHATEARTHGRDGVMYVGRHGGAKNSGPDGPGGSAQTNEPLRASGPASGVTGAPPAPRTPRTTTSCRRATSSG